MNTITGELVDGKELKVTNTAYRWPIQFGRRWYEFVREELNKPGTTVRVGGNSYLIGDVNRVGGICMCCVEIHDSDIVDEYTPPDDGCSRLHSYRHGGAIVTKGAG